MDIVKFKITNKTIKIEVRNPQLRSDFEGKLYYEICSACSNRHLEEIEDEIEETFVKR